MPYGGTTPAQDRKIEKCVGSINGTNPQTKKPYTKSEKIGICKSRIMGKSYLFSDFVSVKAEGDDFFVEGVISSTAPDLGNDVVSDSALDQMAQIINTASSSGKPLAVGYEHTEILGGHPNLVPIGSLVKAWVSEGKLFAKASINKALSIFDEVKSALTRKELHGFSIEYVPGETSTTFIDGVKHRVINTMKALIGVAITGRPLNPEAVMSFAAKNLNFENLNQKVIAMAETKEDPKPTEEEAPEPAAEKPEEEAPAAEEKSYGKDEKKKKKIMEEEKSVDASEYAEFQDFKNKQAQKAEEEKFKSMFTKYYTELSSQSVPAGAPVLNGNKGSVEPMPEMKAWQEALDSGKADNMYMAGAQLIDAIEAKHGDVFGMMPRTPKRSIVASHNSGSEPSSSMAPHKFQIKTVELKAQVEHDTDRTTSGSEYYLSGPLLNDVFGPAVISQLNESHTTYGVLRKENVNGRYGDTYGFRFKYARSGSAGNYDESATDSPTAQATSRKKAHIPFVWYRSVGQVSGPTIEAARGQGGIGDAFALEVRDQTEELINSVNTDIYDTSSPSDGMTRGGQMLSAVYLFDDSTNYTTLYGHDRTSGNFTTLQGVLTAKSNTPDPIKDDLRKMWHDVVSNGASKNDLVFITSFTQHRKIMNLFDDQQRINDTTPDAGFRGMPTFDGIPVFADQHAPAGHIYLWDMRHTFLAVQLPPTVEELAKTGDFRKFQVKSYFALVSTAPNHNALNTGYATS